MLTDKTHFSKIIYLDLFWDIWCIASVVGIWPRFIEPNLLDTARLALPIHNLPVELKGFKIVHLSDLHYHIGISPSFLNRLQNKIKALQPDLIFFYRRLYLPLKARGSGSA
jgi:predicted MPP superfamily phosphohydrolase